jgi:hypothetical protein
MEPSLRLLLLQSAFFIVTWTSVHHWVQKHGQVAGARTLTKINNRIYACASMGLLYLMLLPSASHDDLARRLFHMSKLYEQYVDVLGVRAGGGAVGLHFGFHHLTTPYLTYFRVLRHHELWKLFGALNAFHHALMYAHFGGAALLPGLQLQLRSVLEVTGAAQLLVGMAGEAWLVRRKLRAADDDDDGVVWPNVACFCLLGIYLVLWARDLALRSQAPREMKRRA